MYDSIICSCFSNVQLKFVSPSDEEFACLEQDMKRRLLEGRGEAFYELGLGGTAHKIFSV